MRGTIVCCGLLLCGLLMGSCSDSKDRRLRAAQLSSSCSINSDCEDPLVCAFGRCHEECTSNRDCVGRANCVLAEDGDFRICQLDAEVSCNRDGDCNGDQSCAADGECRDPCEKDSACAEDQLCVKGEAVCADKNEVDASGALIIDRGSTTIIVTTGEGGADSGSGGTSGATGGGAGGGGNGGTGGGTVTINENCTSDAECESGVCDIVCQTPTCSDLVQNGTESGIDCGGMCLTRCANGVKCTSGEDCMSGNCVDDICAAKVCPGEAGVAEMVALPAGFCIDSTEVTRAQYTAWLAKAPSTANQRTECSGNVDFAPLTSCINSTGCSADCDNHPQTCIDWCDAVAYCEGVGKRLCGNLDSSVLSFDPLSLQSQWYYACSSAGRYAFPYGESQDDAACAYGGTTVPVGGFDTCQSNVPGFEGVFDQSGSVLEWEDNCDDATNTCLERGAAEFSDYSLSCLVSTSQARDAAVPGTGFRCCSM